MYSKLTIDDLRLILSEDETQILQSISLDAQLVENINKTIDMIAQMWRQSLTAKGLIIDVRDCYIPQSYAYYVLVHARHAVWTRFPRSSTIALDDARKDEYNQALKLLQNPFLDADKPEWENDPRNPENRTEDYYMPADSIVVPHPLKFPSESPEICKRL